MSAKLIQEIDDLHLKLKTVTKEAEKAADHINLTNILAQDKRAEAEQLIETLEQDVSVLYYSQYKPNNALIVTQTATKAAAQAAAASNPSGATTVALADATKKLDDSIEFQTVLLDAMTRITPDFMKVASRVEVKRLQDKIDEIDMKLPPNASPTSAETTTLNNQKALLVSARDTANQDQFVVVQLTPEQKQPGEYEDAKVASAEALVNQNRVAAVEAQATTLFVGTVADNLSQADAMKQAAAVPGVSVASLQASVSAIKAFIVAAQAHVTTLENYANSAAGMISDRPEYKFKPDTVFANLQQMISTLLDGCEVLGPDSALQMNPKYCKARVRNNLEHGCYFRQCLLPRFTLDGSQLFKDTEAKLQAQEGRDLKSYCWPHQQLLIHNGFSKVTDYKAGNLTPDATHTLMKEDEYKKVVIKMREKTEQAQRDFLGKLRNFFFAKYRAVLDQVRSLEKSIVDLGEGKSTNLSQQEVKTKITQYQQEISQLQDSMKPWIKQEKRDISAGIDEAEEQRVSERAAVSTIRGWMSS